MTTVDEQLTCAYRELDRLRAECSRLNDMAAALQGEAAGQQEWQNEVADALPEEYDDDVSQEAVILAAVKDMAERLETAESQVVAVRNLLSLAKANAERQGSIQGGLILTVDVEYAIAAVSVTQTTTKERNDE